MSISGTDAHAAADPARLLAPGGTVVVGDFTPATGWPPLHEGAPDRARLHWLRHVALHAVELRLAEDLATLVGTRRRLVPAGPSPSSE
ncbi:hypothetical protein [Streptomyces sp. NPDC097610]|uniref:hypothetical protein n=1 Tax=Streptomyces sp. NPDC097610 TaxID=3157227 RepID=UPI00332654B7